MAGTEPRSEEEPDASSNNANGPTTNEGERLAEGGHAQHANSNEQEREIDEFGLPVKCIRRPSTSTLEYQTASEDESGQAKAKVKEHEAEARDPPILVARQESKQQPSIPSTRESNAIQEPPSTDNVVPSKNPPPPSDSNEHKSSQATSLPAADDILHGNTGAVSGWSHQALAPQKINIEQKKEEEDWQSMPAYAPYDLYDDEGHLIAREAPDSDEEANAYHGLGGAGKGYTRVQIDEDAKSATSMDDNTDYLFKPKGTDLQAEDEEQRDPLAQLQATKGLLTEGQRIAYVGITRLGMAEMVKELEDLETTKKTKKAIGLTIESMKRWNQQMMVRLYKHMDVDSSGAYLSNSLLDGDCVLTLALI